MWGGATMAGYDIEPFWINYIDDNALSTAMYFYYEVAMGEHLETFFTPEEALLVLKVDIDLRTSPEFILALPDITVFIEEATDDEPTS